MTDTDTRGLAATLGIGALLLVCCAAPFLIAAGALGALGAWLGSPWVIAGAVLAALAVIATVWRRHRRSHGADRCCPPPSREHQQQPSPQPSNHKEQ
jgi:membrane protein implicated in regulation of membrane protease activity